MKNPCLGWPLAAIAGLAGTLCRPRALRLPSTAIWPKQMALACALVGFQMVSLPYPSAKPPNAAGDVVAGRQANKVLNAAFRLARERNKKPNAESGATRLINKIKERNLTFD